MHGERNSCASVSKRIDTKRFISKWRLYMLALCVLMGGEQLPQVHGKRQVPSVVDIKEMEV